MTADLHARLERELGDVRESVFTEHPGLPVVAPPSEEALCETLRFAGREKLRVRPIGRGSKLGWSTAPEHVDFLVTTSALSGIVAYEPGDGTLTALAGSTASELAEAVQGGGHHFTPDVALPERCTLGGVLAAGQSGRDRHKYGPARHHVLGMRVALADGRIACSGGRLVKNVTGYDLQRLYCGSFGSLCVIVEASLRLFPAPRALVVLHERHESVASALASARTVNELPIDARALTIEELDTSEAVLHLTLAGRDDQVGWAAERVLATLTSAELLEGAAAAQEDRRVRDLEHSQNGWAHLVASCLPSRLEQVLDALKSAAGTRVLLQPAIAEASVFIESSRDDDVRKTVSAITDAGGRVRWRRAHAARPEAPRPHALVRRIESALDPDRIFA